MSSTVIADIYEAIGQFLMDYNLLDEVCDNMFKMSVCQTDVLS